MKTFFLAVLTLIFASSVLAQSQKTAIYCSVNVNGRVNYDDLAKLLPDSLQASVLVDPRKDLNLHKLNHVLMYMLNSGWKLASIEGDVTGGGIVSTSPNYFFTKEIYLDPAARALFMQNLLNSEKRK